MTSNVAPRLCAEFQEASLNGDKDKAIELQDRLMPLHKALFIEPGVCGSKYALSRLGAHRECRAFAAGHRREVDRRADRCRAEACRPDQLRTRAASSVMNQVRKADPNNKTVAENRKARFSYEVLDTVEAGLVLTGTEVKSLRQGQANIQDSYASLEGGEFWLINSYLPEYLQANRFNHEPRRRRKLLLNKREMARLGQSVEREGMTMVPLKIYFNDQGRAKLLLAVAAARSCTTSAKARSSATGHAKRAGC